MEPNHGRLAMRCDAMRCDAPFVPSFPAEDPHTRICIRIPSTLSVQPCTQHPQHRSMAATIARKRPWHVA
jgi:hypothetical protein